jgi:hypothetical protein
LKELPSCPLFPAIGAFSIERDRIELFSRGDLFRDVPLSSPLPADELVVDEEGGGSRRFLSGPLEFGPVMPITPSCSLGAQGGGGYAHPVRTLAPVLPLAELVERSVVKETVLDDLRRFDHLINYMYLPPLDVDEIGFRCLRASRCCTCRSRSTTPSLMDSVCRSLPSVAHSSCSGSSCGTTPAGSRTTSISWRGSLVCAPNAPSRPPSRGSPGGRPGLGAARERSDRGGRAGRRAGGRHPEVQEGGRAHIRSVLVAGAVLMPRGLM